jgi:hypothetical protein
MWNFVIAMVVSGFCLCQPFGMLSDVAFEDASELVLLKHFALEDNKDVDMILFFESFRQL